MAALWSFTSGVDDYVTDPTGKRGDRAACGLIVAD